MAKKNSSKTRTQEATQASIPQQVVIQGWQGINIDEAPPNWSAGNNEVPQGDMLPNNLLVQNNIDTTDMKCIETRREAYTLFRPDGFELAGASYIKDNYLFLSAISNGKQFIVVHDVASDDDTNCVKIPFDTGDIDGKVECIYSYHDSYNEYLLVTAVVDNKVCLFDRIFSEAIAGEELHKTNSIGRPQQSAIAICHDIDLSSSYASLWKNLIDYTRYISTGKDTVETSVLKVTEYGGAVSDVSCITDKTKWYIVDNPTDKCYDLIFLDTVYPYRSNIWFTVTVTQGLYAANWIRKLHDGMSFDKAWIYQGYKDGTVAPSSVKSPNAWITSVEDTYLFEEATWSRWSSDPIQSAVGVYSDPDTEYIKVYETFSSALSEDTNGVVFGVGATGDLWVMTRAVRNSTGTDTKLYYKASESLPDYNDTGATTAYLTFYYAYANRWGQTEINTGYPLHINATVAPVNFTMSKYLTLIATNVPSECERVNFYYTLDESDNPQFVGYAVPTNGVASYNWYGSMTNTDEWMDANLTVESEDTTAGAEATQVTSIDGRLYWWGNPDKPYRLYIGGDTGHELSCADGYGGAWLDIEPGIGTIVNGVWKWKTQSGASIVTILCGNKNSSKHKRYNLVENNITLSNELEEKSYMFEEIANTLGCQNRWGAGVWQDGLYVLTRYGLRVTTMAMEYNSQIMAANVSNAVNPIFENNLGTLLDNARMIEINGVMYIVFGTEDGGLDNVIICYNSALDSWYTYTYGDNDTDILHIMNIDYVGATEGIGLICKDHVGFIPTTSAKQWEEPEKVNFMFETGALSPINPASEQIYLASLEFRFDWFVGDADIDITGVDMYGRRVHIKKHAHTDELVNNYTVYVRGNIWVEQYNITMTGEAMFRLMYIAVKFFRSVRSIGLYRGFDSLASYRDAHNKEAEIRHYIRNYANLRQVLLT